MEQKTTKRQPSAPQESRNSDNVFLELRLEKKKNDVISFNNSIIYIKEMILYFEDKNHKTKKNYKNYENLNTLLKSVDCIVIIGATSTSVFLSITGVDLLVAPISAGIACGSSLCKKLLKEVVIKKHKKYKKQSEKDRQTFKSFDKLYRHSLQDIIFTKKIMNLYVIVLKV